MLEARIRDDLRASMRNKQDVKKDILRVIIGDIDRVTNRLTSLDDDKIIKIIQKIIAANEETLKFGENKRLVAENEILSSYLPIFLSENDIISFLKEKVDISTAKSRGEAVGITIKALKKENLSFDNNLVKKVVETMID